jgi:hypothetical protein
MKTVSLEKDEVVRERLAAGLSCFRKIFAADKEEMVKNASAGIGKNHTKESKKSLTKKLGRVS